ncbi:MAG: sensor domain-containing diguanylate cyclase [Agarilytica sp.]
MTEASKDVFNENQALQAKLLEYEQRLQEESQKRDLIQSIGETIDLDRVLDLVAEQLKTLNLFDGFLINLFDDTYVDPSGKYKGRLVCELVSLPDGYEGIENTYLKYHFPNHTKDANIEAFRQRSIVYVDHKNVSNFPKSTQTRFERWQIHHQASIPIIVDKGLASENPVGTLMAFKQHENINQETIDKVEELFTLFSRPLDNAIGHARLKQREKEIETAHSEHQRFLNFISTVNNLTQEDHIYEQISREFLRRFPFDMVGVVMCEDDKLALKKLSISDEKFRQKHIAWKEYYSETTYDLDLADGATPTVFLQNSHFMVPDVLNIMHLPMSDKDSKALKLMETPRTFFFMPIRKQDKAIGVLWLISMENPVLLPPSNIQLVELLCSFIGTAISNAQNYSLVDHQNKEIEVLNADLQARVEQLKELASKDRLTGLFNYGAFEQELERRVCEYNRAPTLKLSLILFDVDHFKRLNDSYGHVAGNDVLQEIARRVKIITRRMDIAFRYGGEEFCIILPKCDLEGSIIFAERLRKVFSDEEFNADGHLVSVTTSVGCAQFLANEDPDSFVERADKALYEAKKNGRNKVFPQPQANNEQ